MADHKHTNRLAKEASPYLQQHAHNPVDWYPWGEEAFERARREGRPIFLSVGYSTCYWCHVMERESFENEAVAADMNRWFVNIKVDREQRPDVDQLYMTAVQLMTRSGGWPMSVFLTPDLKPFYCGTYFPPTDVAGRPGLTTLLRSIADAWSERRDEVQQAAESLTGALRQYALPAGNEAELAIDAAFIDNLIGRCIADYDEKHGGFGTAPKFPRETLLELMSAYTEQTPVETQSKADIRRMLAHTLEMMARGGIRDQLGGAFHRYSTDQRWLVPHFEIMLYDNAMLLGIYARAAQAMRRQDFAEVARGIADFIISDMTGPQGQFYTALDAEVDGHEGASYLWTPAQIAEVLTEDEAAIFNVAYGLDSGSNFQDPHHPAQPETNVLYMPRSMEELAKKLGTEPAAIEAVLLPARAKLLAARRKRQGPLLDTKVLTQWNALMIRGMAMAGRLLDEPRYTSAALRAMEFLLHHHRALGGGLYRASRDGQSSVAAFLDDYAATAQALLELHGSTGEQRWLTEAQEMLAQMLRRFSSSAGAMYFTDAGAEEVLVRQIVATDSPLPSGNASAAQALLALGNAKQAAAIIAAFAGSLETHAEASSALVQAAMEYVARYGPITVPPRDVSAELQGMSQRGAQAVTARAERTGDHHARVIVEIAAGFHIYASETPAGLYPTRVSLEGGAHAEVTYPKATRQLPLEGSASAGIYEGQVPIEIHTEQPLTGLKAIVQAQPCSETACLTPVRLVVQL